jgi:menaquinone-9 beta-reductase
MPGSHDNFDLAVIGGGPAGTSAAIMAASLGAQTVLLEAGDFPRQKVCGEFVSAESLDMVRNLLLLVPEADEVLHAAPVINRARLFLAGEQVHTVVSPPALSIPRYQLDRLLWGAAKRAGVHTCANTEVRSLAGEGPFFLGTATTEFRAAAVIIAAGRWSRFRPNIQIPSGPKWIGLKAHFREDQPPPSTDLYFFEHGYCGVQPVGPGTVNACVMVRSDRATALDHAISLHPDLAERSRAWQAVTEPVSTAPLIYRTPEPVRGNLVFVGDAAAFIDPFVGDGISIAVRSGSVAALELATVWRGSDLREAVNRYQRTYEARFVPLVRAASRIRALMSLPRPLVAAGLPILRLPGVLPYLIRKTRHVA